MTLQYSVLMQPMIDTGSECRLWRLLVVLTVAIALCDYHLPNQQDIANAS